MKNRGSKFGSYVIVSLIYMLVGGGILYLLLCPVGKRIEGKVQMIIVKGAPNYPNEYDEDVYQLLGESKDTSEVQIPREGTLYGYIYCTDIELSAPIYYGDSEESLLQGAGQYVGSGLPGEGRQILIGGHDSTFFSPLEKIQVGQRIQIVTNYGSYEYEVSSTKVADAMDDTTYDLSKKVEELVLYTCYKDQRFFVYADFVDTKEVAP